jgi:polyphosphate kinase
MRIWGPATTTSTARIYTDLGLLTADEEIAAPCTMSFVSHRYAEHNITLR